MAQKKTIPWTRICKRSVVVSLVVGTVLNLINQPMGMLGREELDLLKAVLTYFVPFAVSTYGAYSILRSLDKEER